MKKENKKSNWLLVLFIIITIAIIVCALFYREQSLEIIKSKVVPIVSSAVGGIAFLYALTKQYIFNLSDLALKLKNAKEKIDTEVDNAEDNRETLKEASESIKETNEQLKTQVIGLTKDMYRVMRVIYIMASNDATLVKKGVSKDIADLLGEEIKNEDK